jgi:uncharacterized LabA/DUF88 family protein
MNTVPAASTSPVRIRIFIDFWNFSLTIKGNDSTFKTDWAKIPALLTQGAQNLLGTPCVYEAMHVYGSYDKTKSEDAKFKNWFSNSLDKMPGVHTVMLERQRKRSFPKCPHCYSEVQSCAACSKDMRGTEEKGIDSQIVTDLVSLAWSNGYDVGILVSADKDFVPAANLLQSRGIKIIHGAFPPNGSHLTKQCWGSVDVGKLMPQFQR